MAVKQTKQYTVIQSNQTGVSDNCIEWTEHVYGKSK